MNPSFDKMPSRIKDKYDEILSGRRLEELSEDDVFLVLIEAPPLHRMRLYDAKFLFQWFEANRWDHAKCTVPETRQLFSYTTILRLLGRGFRMGWTKTGRRGENTVQQVELWVGQLSPPMLGDAVREVLEETNHVSVASVDPSRGHQLSGPAAGSYLESLIRNCSLASPPLQTLYPEFFLFP